MFAFLTEPISLLGLRVPQENQVLRRDVVRREHLGRFQHLLGSLLVQLLDWKIVLVLPHLGIRPHLIQLPRISILNYQQARYPGVFWLYHHINLSQRRMHYPKAFDTLGQFSQLLQRPVSIRVYPARSISALSMKILSVKVHFYSVLILWFAPLSPEQNHSTFQFRQLTFTRA